MVTRDKQKQAIRKFLKELGATGIKMVDGNTVPNEKYRDAFIASDIDTFFFYVEKPESDRNRFKDYGYVEYENYIIYFNASSYMKYAVDNFKTSPITKIKIIVVK